jgi:hypothetical protein
MAEFFTYLRSLPDVPESFTRVVETRAQERANTDGRLEYLSGNVRAKSLAMASELALQSHYYLLHCAKDGSDANLGAAMEAATHAAKAWEAIRRL